MGKVPSGCKWITLQEALAAFAENVSGHQGSEHIKPLHWYVACRLVIEGGFHPDDITPRPPFEVDERGRDRSRRHILTYSPERGDSKERVILGGLKTKSVDVVVSKEGIGPTIAVSMKGTLNAFRNLTNRMEEAVGDCTNLHISYPALVYGFLHVLRAIREREGVLPGDIAICQDGQVSDSIRRYHNILQRLADRNDVRDVTTKYEAIGLALVNPDAPNIGELITTFPEANSTLQFSQFLEKLYGQYDQRFVYAAPALSTTTRRLEWDDESPVVSDARYAGYNPRVLSRNSETAPPPSS